MIAIGLAMSVASAVAAIAQGWVPMPDGEDDLRDDSVTIRVTPGAVRPPTPYELYLLDDDGSPLQRGGLGATVWPDEHGVRRILEPDHFEWPLPVVSSAADLHFRLESGTDEPLFADIRYFDPSHLDISGRPVHDPIERQACWREADPDIHNPSCEITRRSEGDRQWFEVTASKPAGASRISVFIQFPPADVASGDIVSFSSLIRLFAVDG